MNNNAQMPWNNDIINIINIASFLLSVENLQLNKQDLTNSTLNKHLQEQDKILHEQNDKYLTKIVEQNEELLKLLKGDKQ